MYKQIMLKIKYKIDNNINKKKINNIDEIFTDVLTRQCGLYTLPVYIAFF